MPLLALMSCLTRLNPKPGGPGPGRGSCSAESGTDAGPLRLAMSSPLQKHTEHCKSPNLIQVAG